MAREGDCEVPATAACTVLNAFHNAGLGSGDLDCDGVGRACPEDGSKAAARETACALARAQEHLFNPDPRVLKGPG